MFFLCFGFIDLPVYLWKAVHGVWRWGPWPLRSKFSLCHGRKKQHLWLLVSFLAASSHHVWTTKRKWLQAIDITLDTHKITVLLQFFWFVLPRYECRVGKMSKLCQNVTPVMKSRDTFFSCINNLCFLHCDIRIGSAVQNCHTMPPLDQQIYLNHFKTPNSLAGLKQSMLAWSFRSGVSQVPRRFISDLRAFHFLFIYLGQSYIPWKMLCRWHFEVVLNLTLGRLGQMTAISLQWWFHLCGSVTMFLPEVADIFQEELHHTQVYPSLACKSWAENCRDMCFFFRKKPSYHAIHQMNWGWTSINHDKPGAHEVELHGSWVVLLLLVPMYVLP